MKVRAGLASFGCMDTSNRFDLSLLERTMIDGQPQHPTDETLLRAAGHRAWMESARTMEPGVMAWGYGGTFVPDFAEAAFHKSLSETRTAADARAVRDGYFGSLRGNRSGTAYERRVRANVSTARHVWVLRGCGPE